MSSLLSIGKSGLMAAQAGLATTGHNITNANVPGYNRQVVIQGTTAPISTGVGFIGTGTEVAQIKRYYDDFLNKQLLGAQANQASLDNYFSQISQIDNLLADTTVGLSPALQGFFDGIQQANSAPSSNAARSAMLSSAESLAARFTGLSARLQELQDGVTSSVTSSVSQINSYASRIADLNQQIASLSLDPNIAPNDLLDQRDQLINELNKQVKVSVAQGDNHMLNVSFGTGQPLVVGNLAQTLATGFSDTDPGRIVVGYQTPGKFAQLPDNVITGGQLGGTIQFRNSALDQAQNKLGQLAAGLAASVNAQHKLGVDLNGAAGGNFFKDIQAYVGYDRDNSSLSTIDIQAKIVDASALTTSDYDVDFNGTNLVVTRKSDGFPTTITVPTGTPAPVIDGVEYTITGAAAAGDHFLVRPTYTAASQMQVAITDPAKIALAAPISTSVPTTNTGKATMSPGSVDSNYLLPGNALAAPVNLTYSAGTNTLSGFPAGQPVTVTLANGSSTTYAAGTPVPFTSGANISFGGVNFSVSGQPADLDKFNILNSSGVGDNRNGVLLAGLQSKNILDGGKTNFQAGYASLTNFVGNKAREVQIASTAADTAVSQASAAQQAVSGVNLDEEAANLIRYQQAYQAAGKVMQTASQLFDVLLSLGS
jgi:flagellar hook-associated protein 1 FlgK